MSPSVAPAGDAVPAAPLTRRAIEGFRRTDTAATPAGGESPPPLLARRWNNPAVSQSSGSSRPTAAASPFGVAEDQSLQLIYGDRQPLAIYTAVVDAPHQRRREPASTGAIAAALHARGGHAVSWRSAAGVGAAGVCPRWRVR